MKLSKLLSLGLVVSTLITSLTLSASAITPSHQAPVVYSPEFPDAYIVTEVTPETQNLDVTSGSLGSVSATVFVEESYDIVNGELTVTDSRLLSENEVKAIGEENFLDLNDAPIPQKTATASRGKLTITFAGTHSLNNGGVSCTLTGTAGWARPDIIGSNSNNPTPGEDFIGVTWFGGFTALKTSISGTDNMHQSLKIYSADSVPNGGRVWSFEESIVHPKYSTYAADMNLSLTLSKNKLTGDGNTAEAVLKYIHTYSKVNGSISITPGTDSAAGSFSLSNTKDQWSITCTIHSIPY